MRIRCICIKDNENFKKGEFYNALPIKNINGGLYEYWINKDGKLNRLKPEFFMNMKEHRLNLIYKIKNDVRE